MRVNVDEHHSCSSYLHGVCNIIYIYAENYIVYTWMCVFSLGYCGTDGCMYVYYMSIIHSICICSLYIFCCEVY